MNEQRWVPEGPVEEYAIGEVRYLRGDGEGGLQVRLLGMKPGATVRVLPDGIHKGRARGQFVRATLAYGATSGRVKRLNADEKAAWLIGMLWSKGLRGLEYHVDLAYRVEYHAE